MVRWPPLTHWPRRSPSSQPDARPDPDQNSYIFHEAVLLPTYPPIVLSSSPSLTSNQPVSTSGQQSLDDAAWTRPFTSSAVSCVVRVWEVKREFLHLHICMFRQTMITGHSRGDSEDIPDRDWTHDGRMKFSNYGWYRCIGAGQKDSDKSWYFINIFNALFVIASILSCLFNQSIVYKKFVQAIRKFIFYFRFSISFLKNL